MAKFSEGEDVGGMISGRVWKVAGRLKTIFVDVKIWLNGVKTVKSISECSEYDRDTGGRGNRKEVEDRDREER